MSASIGFSPVPSSFQREREGSTVYPILISLRIAQKPSYSTLLLHGDRRQPQPVNYVYTSTNQPPLMPNMTGNISPPDPSSNTRPCRPSRRGTTLVFDVPVHANTFDTANSSSGRLRVSLRPVLSVSIPFRILYFCPCAFLTAERTAAGDTNSTPSEMEQANGQ
jgi:hypothetical protein